MFENRGAVGACPSEYRFKFVFFILQVLFFMPSYALAAFIRPLSHLMPLLRNIFNLYSVEAIFLSYVVYTFDVSVNFATIVVSVIFLQRPP